MHNCVQCELTVKLTPLFFLRKFFQRLRIFSQDFTRLFLHIRNYIKWRCFNQLTLTLTNLCCIKRRTVQRIFIFHSKNAKNCDILRISATVWPISMKFDKMTEFLSASAVKILNFKNPRWRTANSLEWPILHHYEMQRFFWWVISSWHPRRLRHRAHPRQIWRHSQNRKCITHCSVARDGPSRGHARKISLKSGRAVSEIRSQKKTDLRTDRSHNTALSWPGLSIGIGWHWRDFVPYLCQLVSAAILWVKLWDMFVTVRVV